MKRIVLALLFLSVPSLARADYYCYVPDPLTAFLDTIFGNTCYVNANYWYPVPVPVPVYPVPPPPVYVPPPPLPQPCEAHTKKVFDVYGRLIYSERVETCE